MKKIIVTEEQSKKLVSKMLSEQYRDNDRYSQKVKVDFDYYKLMYKGQEVDWIPSDQEITVSYRIDLEYREYGIKSISVYDFAGPESIDVPITYYPEGSEDSEDDYVEIRLDWDGVETEEADLGYIGIDGVIQIALENDETGNIVNRSTGHGYSILISVKDI